MRFLNKSITTIHTTYHQLWYFFYLLVFITFLASPCSAQSVVINEFATSQTQSIELINIGSENINLGGWYLDDSGGTTHFTIPQNTEITPLQCIVFQGDFNLNTASSDTVRLFDAASIPTQISSVPIDSFSYTVAPPDGQSYSRNPDGSGNFLMSISTLGKYNSNGTSCSSTGSPEPSPTPSISQAPSLPPTPTASHTPTPTPAQAFDKAKIFISEFLPNPTVGNEWVELYNANLFDVTLDGFSIDDFADSGSSPQIFSMTIGAQSYAVVEITSSILNNDSDMVRLLDENQDEIGFYFYSSSKQNISWGTKDDVSYQSFCMQASSKAAQNTPCIEASSTPTQSPTKTSTPTKTPTSSPSPSLTPISYTGVYISEFLAKTDNAHPDEWIEIYNDNRFSVSLKNWSVGDTTDPKSQTFTLDIDPYRFAVVELTSSRLNNDGDAVYLYDGQDNLIDSFAYSETTGGTSWGRKPGEFGTWCMQNPSKNDFNSGCISPLTATPTKTPTPTKSSTPTKTNAPTKTPTGVSTKSNATSANILGVSAKKQSSPILLAYTPRSGSQKLLPFSFAVDAQSNMQGAEYSEPDEQNTNSLLSQVLGNPILSSILIITLSFLAGILTFDLAKLWQQEKIAEYED